MISLTNSIRRLVDGLSEVKNRRTEGLFKAEGTKCVADTLGHFRLRMLVATDEWLSENTPEVDAGLIVKSPNREMSRMSSLSCPPKVIAVYEIPADEYDPVEIDGSLVLALDSIQDPGNLGTIVRTADWFGVSRILCSRSTADIFSPKAVQASMGAISRVRLHYCDLAEELGRASDRGMNLFGTFMNGDNVFTTDLPEQGIIVMGNEGRGVSEEVSRAITRRLTIPSYPPGIPTSESLNVATATSIILAQFRARLFKLT